MKQKDVESRSGKQAGRSIVKVVLAVVVLAIVVAYAAGGAAAVDAADVDVPIRAANGAQRVSFAGGVEDMTLRGAVVGQGRKQIVFWGTAGQELLVSVTSPQNSTLFHLEGADYKQVYKHLLDGENSWQGTLSLSQDYVLTIDNSGIPAEYTVELAIID